MNRTLFAALLCAAPALAQVPYGHLIAAYRVPSATVSALQIIDPNTGAVTPLVPSTGALTNNGSRTVAIDPAGPNVIYSAQSLAISTSPAISALTLNGNVYSRANLNVALGASGLIYKLRFAPGFGLLLLGRGGTLNRMFLRNMSTGAVTQQPTPTLLPNNASDLAFSNGKAYASSEGDGSTILNGTIIQWDLAGNVDTLVGNSYPPITALAPYNGLLLAGSTNGNLYLVDPVTGAAPLFLSPGLGRINSIAVDQLNRIFILTENGSSWAVWSIANLTTPLYTASAALDDLKVGPTPVPTVLTYGAGCAGSNLSVPVFAFGNPPAIGGPFPCMMNGGLPSSVSVFVLGLSRVMDSSGPLPRSLAALGMPGCTQYTDIAASLFTPTTAQGGAVIGVNIPNNQALAGLQVPMQWLCLDPAANAFGATTSNGAEAHLR
jgi:hypothetical protein